MGQAVDAQLLRDLQQQALAQIAGSDAGRVEVLNPSEYALDYLRRLSRSDGDLLDRACQKTVVVDIADDLFADRDFAPRITVVLVELLEEMVPEVDRGFGDLDRKSVV